MAADLVELIMTIHAQSSNADVVSQLAVADPDACAEFVRRQSADKLAGLVSGMAVLYDQAGDIQCQRVEELMAYKYPDAHQAIDSGLLRTVLDAAHEGDIASLVNQMKAVSFDNLAAFRSIAVHIKGHAQARLKYGYVDQATDPQMSFLD